MSENNNRPRGPRGHGAMGNGEKAKDFKGTVGKLMKYIGAYKIQIFFVIIFAICSTVFSIVGPDILGDATQELYLGISNKMKGVGGIDFDKIASILTKLIILYICSALFSYIQGFIMTGVTQNLTYKLRREISEKIHRMPMKYFDTKTHGETLSIITNDIDTLSMSLNQSATQLITSVISFVGMLVMMFSIDWAMTLISLGILVLSFMIIPIIIHKSQKYFQNQQKYLGNVNGHIEETFSGHSIVRVFNKEDEVLNEFEDLNGKLYETAWKSQFLSGLMQPVMIFIGNLNYVVIAIVGGYFAVKGRITVGNILSFTQYSRQVSQPVSQIAQVSNLLQSMAAAAERVFEFLDEDEEVQTAENPVSTNNIKGNVEFSHIHFGYNPEKIIINDFSAKVNAGQKIAIVGPTGAGKTTMIKLLMRFYDVNSGSIMIDGHDLRDFNRSDLRELFGMVLQDTWLFNGSIKENIRYGRLDATDEEVIQAAKSAHVHHFIQTLPNGYDMCLNEEADNISQGQKQLLTIARAILADPKILILDEATSSVDTRTEIQIQKAMDNLMKGRTSFIIAHRLSTIRDADLILVMKDGDIIEQGNHDELLAKNGFYAELYRSQFERESA